jgi:hypothetical protein
MGGEIGHRRDTPLLAHAGNDPVNCGPATPLLDKPAVAAPSERLLSLWNSPLLNRLWFLCLVQATLIGACALRAWIGLGGMRNWVHDGFFLLDGAWRVRNGQVPYNDFFTDIGPLVHVLNAFGLILARDMPAGLGYAQAVAALIAGAWAFGLSRRRLSSAGSILVTAVLVFLALGPFELGNKPTMTSPAMVYNRYGFAFVALGLIEAACPRRLPTRLSDFLGGVSTGVIAILLLFIKVSYFPGLVLLLLLLFGCLRQTLWRWTGFLAGAAAAFLPFLMYLRGTLVPMWRDLQMLAGAKHVVREWFLIEAVYGSAIPLAVFAFLAFALLSRWGALVEGRRVLTIGIAVAAIGMFFVPANFPGTRLPLNAVAAVIIVDRVQACFFAGVRSESVGSESIMCCSVLLSGAMFIFVPLFLDAAGLGYAVHARDSVATLSGSTFNEPTLAGFSTFDVGYVHFVNNGLALAQQNRRPNDTIVSLDYSNPFSYAFRIRPAWGGTPMGIQFRTNFDDRNHVEPERLFGHASLVMIPQPQTFSDYTLAANIPRIYGPWLEHHFHLIGETVFWRVYRNDAGY